jgi:predicted permease
MNERGIRLLEIVWAAVRRPFGGWRQFSEFLVFVGVCVAGVANASWLWIVIGALALLLLTWARWEALFAKAGKVDAEWRDLGTLARRQNVGRLGLDYYLRARTLIIVLGAKVGHDALFLAGAFLFGRAARWFWLG